MRKISEETKQKWIKLCQKIIDENYREKKPLPIDINLYNHISENKESGRIFTPEELERLKIIENEKDQHYSKEDRRLIAKIILFLRISPSWMREHCNIIALAAGMKKRKFLPGRLWMKIDNDLVEMIAEEVQNRHKIQ